MRSRMRSRSFFLSCLISFLVFYIYFTKLQDKNKNVIEEQYIKRQIRGPLSSLDQNLIKEVAKQYLVPPSSNKYNLLLYNVSNDAKKYNSKYQELPAWKYLNIETRKLFPPNLKKNGFYIEAGAFDGEYWSNSLFLELEYGWNGLLIEPDKGLFMSLLKKNRKAWSCHCCLSTNSYPHETILKKIETSDGDLLSSLHQRAYNSISESETHDIRNRYGVQSYEVVQCIPLHTLLLALNQTHVDLIYLDVEDVETKMLKNFAWDKIAVDVWIVEHRNPNTKDFEKDIIDENFIKWFESKGHVLYKVAPYLLDYIFIKKNTTFYLENHERLFL